MGGGYITIRPSGTSGRLIIKKRNILINLVKLINGHMRTPKIEALHRLINWINVKNNESIPLLGLDKIALHESSWLSGMLEADGSFYLNWKTGKNNLSIGIIYYLTISQKQTYNRKLDPNMNIDNFPHMEKIAKVFNSRVINIERKKETYVEKAYVVKTDKIESKILMFEYLNKFPLFGYKYFAQTGLFKIHDLILRKEHKTEIGQQKLYEYKKFMKIGADSGVEFTHLDNFYKS